jgi:hypothetical protein
MDRTQAARIGALTRWAHTEGTEGTAPARRGFRRRFELEVDPDGVLDAVERGRRADRAMRAHMLQLAHKSAAARRKGAA